MFKRIKLLWQEVTPKVADITDFEGYQFIAQLDSWPDQCDSVFAKDLIYFYVLQDTCFQRHGFGSFRRKRNYRYTFIVSVLFLWSLGIFQVLYDLWFYKSAKSWYSHPKLLLFSQSLTLLSHFPSQTFCLTDIKSNMSFEASLLVSQCPSNVVHRNHWGRLVKCRFWFCDGSQVLHLHPASQWCLCCRSMDHTLSNKDLNAPKETGDGKRWAIKQTLSETASHVHWCLLWGEMPIWVQRGSSAPGLWTLSLQSSLCHPTVDSCGHITNLSKP